MSPPAARVASGTDGPPGARGDPVVTLWARLRVAVAVLRGRDSVRLDVAALRAEAHMTYNGGHDGTHCTAFHHGMDTAFNVVAVTLGGRPAPAAVGEA